ncbi:MAG: hypothetical protein J7L39_01150 [Candidatus Aenigmarchaeota archaeon]|nr:hypothetical protein [Candidatus Aenigmarchaeota archaeon]
MDKEYKRPMDILKGKSNPEIRIIESKPAYQTFENCVSELYEKIKPPKEFEEFKRKSEKVYKEIKKNTKYLKERTGNGKIYKDLITEFKNAKDVINATISKIKNYVGHINEEIKKTKENIFDPVIERIEKSDWYENDKREIIERVNGILRILKEYSSRISNYELELSNEANTRINRVLKKEIEEIRGIAEKIANQKINVLNKNLEDRKKRVSKLLKLLEGRDIVYQDDELLEVHGNGVYKSLREIDDILSESSEALKNVEKIYKYKDLDVSEIQKEDLIYEIEKIVKTLRYIPKVIEAIDKEYKAKMEAALLKTKKYSKLPLMEIVEKYIPKVTEEKSRIPEVPSKRVEEEKPEKPEMPSKPRIPEVPSKRVEEEKPEKPNFFNFLKSLGRACKRILKGTFKDLRKYNLWEIGRYEKGGYKNTFNQKGILGG